MNSELSAATDVIRQSRITGDRHLFRHGVEFWASLGYASPGKQTGGPKTPLLFTFGEQRYHPAVIPAVPLMVAVASFFTWGVDVLPLTAV